MNKNDILKFLKDFKTKNSEKYGIIKLGLFGSYARGEEHKDSDVDVVAFLNFSNLVKLSSMRQDIEEGMQMHIDLIEYRNHMNRFLKERIDNEGIYV